MNSILRKLLLLFFLFVYGIAIGNYKIFPFEQVQWLKHKITGKHIFDENDHYADRLELFKIRNPEATVVMLGDSITEAGDWLQLLGEKDILNRGIGGDTTTGVLRRMDFLGKQPKKCFVMIGINDFTNKSTTVDEIINNYSNIIDALTAKNTTPIIQSTLYTYNQPDLDNSKVAELNMKLKILADSKKIVFIDLNKKLAPNGILLKELTTDGVHLNTRGYIMWSNLIENYIK